jgi:hypothetical protein
MKIWIDGDACPKAVKEMVFRVADRTKTPVVLVANQWIRLPPSAFITLIQVEQGADIADDEIVRLCAAGDLIITADIPLAARVVDKDAWALDPRGKMYDKNNIKQILAMRNFMDNLRGSGVETGGPNSFGQQHTQQFANELDRFITRSRV